MNNTFKSFLVGGSFAVLLSSCAVGPNYKKPEIPAPPAFRGAMDGTEQQPSVADTKWHDLFQDPILTDLVETALKQNYDLRIAAERVLQAQAQLGIVRADYYPTLTGNAGFTANRQSRIGSIPFAQPGARLDVGYTQLSFGVSWELDVWGRIRRLNEAARGQFLATQEARHAVITTLISDVTSGYFQLRELDLELEIAKKTQAIGENGLRLTNLRRTQGVATGLDVNQAEQLLRTANARLAAIERSMIQSENALNLLLARPPGTINRGKPLEQFTVPAQVPAGLPSDLLARRPDIRQAEQTLIAANARIGAVKATYFPQINLTGLLGTQSRMLTELFTDPSKQMNFAPTLVAPLFNAGRIRNNVRYTEAQKREVLISYEKTVMNSFREVSDSLTVFTKTREQREEQEKLVHALRESDRLSNLRYKGGMDSYLQVLDAQRNLFEGDLNLAKLRLQELNAVVQLYRTLGGGWQ